MLATRLVFLSILFSSCSSLSNVSAPSEGYFPNCYVSNSTTDIELHCPNKITAIISNQDDQNSILFRCYDEMVPSNFLRLLDESIKKNTLTIIFLNCSTTNPIFKHLWNSETSLPMPNQIGIGRCRCHLPGKIPCVYIFSVLSEVCVCFGNTYFETISDSLFTTTLRVLDINYTNHTEISETLFQNAHNLRKLYLDHNKLKYLPTLLFKTLVNLIELSLSYNELTDLNENIFDGLYQLRSLSLNNNKLQSLPASIFNSLQELHDLDISRNYFTTVNEFLRPLTNLDSLKINSCNLRYTGNDTFPPNMPWLRFLEFGNNQFYSSSEIGWKSISSTFLNSSQLCLENCSINEIFSDLLDTSRLVQLDISKNNIREIPLIVLSRKSILNILLLNNNMIENIHPKAFQNLTELEKVDLSFNELRYLHPETFQIIHSDKTSSHNAKVKPNNNLKILLLGHNLLEYIHPNIFHNLTRLECLDLSQNKINSLHVNMFENTNNIQYLNVSHNRISNVSNHLQQLENLRTLDLSHNELTRFPNEVLSRKYNLMHLDLSFNKITGIYIHNELNGVLPLRKLLLRNNYITDIGYGSLYYFNSLVYLDLANNLINVECTLELSSVELLQYLDLSNNSLTEMYSTLREEFKSLNYLNLSNNRITAIPTSYLRYVSFNLTVNIQHNLLKSVDLRTGELNIGNQESNSSVTMLLNHNPFTCTCDVFKFLRFQDRDLHLSPGNRNVATIKADELRCSEPRVLEETLVENVEDWAPQSLALWGLCLL